MVNNFTNPEVIAVDFDPFKGPEIVFVTPATQSQASIWLSYTLNNSSQAFNESVSVRYKGVADKQAMKQALQELARRHGELRTVFSADGKQACVFNELPIDLSYQDVSQETTQKREQLVSVYAEQEASHSFNLIQGPLFRTTLVKLTEQDYQLILTAHRIILLEKSVTSLVQELNSRYDEKVAAPALAPVGYSYSPTTEASESEKVEHILRTIKGVKDAVVIQREDRPGDKRLVAYVVPDLSVVNNKTTSLKEQIQIWKQRLSAMLPGSAIPEDFVVVEDFPLTSGGKVDRQALPKPIVTEKPTTHTSPRTDAERLVADVWRETLGLKKVNIYDNFFEVGGHSLTAVQLMTRLEKKTGKRLPPATLFEHSTIEKLAKLLPMDNGHHSWSSLVLLKPGTNKVPLYIVHGANSHVLQFNTLASNMAPDQPVYGLQAKGINGVDEPLTTIEEMAAHYISEILSENPNGPYALSGFSFGGMVAYEMANQLRAMGKEVTVLAMLDAYALRSNSGGSELKKSIDSLLFKVNRFSFFIKLLMSDPHGAIEYKMIPMGRRYNKFLQLFGKGKKVDKKNPYGYSMKLFRVYEQAINQYQLEPQPVKIELFRAKRRREYAEDLKYLGWKPYALKGIDVHEIPGEHGTLFYNENVKEFANILQKVLDKYQ